LKYFFKYVAGLSEETVSASFVFGRAIHRAVEFHFRELLAGCAPPDLDTLLTEFQAGWEEQPAESIVFPKTETRDSLGQLADRMLRVFRDSDLARPSGRILAVEEELRGQLLPGVPDLVARIDLLVESAEGITITDYKTSRSEWTDGKANDSAEQLLLYSELVRSLLPGRPIRLEFAVATKTKEVVLSRHRVTPSPARVERTKAVVRRVWDAIDAGHFYPAPSAMNCPTCPFRQPCRHWSG
jgi:RecB family exonuclease